MLDISIIIPTGCETSRCEVLNRSIDSVLSQKGVALELILVLNGPRVDDQVAEQLHQHANIRIIRLPDGNVSLARLAGIRAVRGELFCFLDDDDEFLSGALKIRVSTMRSIRDADVVVTNGLIREIEDQPMVSEAFAKDIKANLPKSILKINWFASAASTFRKAAIEESLFDFPYRYFEWTFLFFSLIANKKNLLYIHNITYRKYENTPLSVSKSDAYLLSCPSVLLDVLRLPISIPLKTGVKRKLCSALNAVSKLHRRRNEFLSAWISHLRCLKYGGWRFAPYTWTLMRGLFSAN